MLMASADGAGRRSRITPVFLIAVGLTTSEPATMERFRKTRGTKLYVINSADVVFGFLLTILDVRAGFVACHCVRTQRRHRRW